MGKKLLPQEVTHRDWALAEVTSKYGSMAVLDIFTTRPSTVVIYNVPTTDANWTLIKNGLTGVMAWRLVERDGNPFHYCFDGVGTTYVTENSGSIQEDTQITAIYAKRTGASNINLQLEVWTI